MVDERQPSHSPASIPSLRGARPTADAPLVSIVTPAMNEEENLPALHERIVSALDGMRWEWIVVDDWQQSVFAWLRKGRDPRAQCLVVVNFTPAIRRDYAVRVPFGGYWREALNTDAEVYGGTNVGNGGGVSAVQAGDRTAIHLTIPPLGALFLVPEH